MATNSRKNEKIFRDIANKNMTKNETRIAYFMIAFCVFEVVGYVLYLIKFEWGVVFFIFSNFWLTSSDNLDTMRINFPFWWLVPTFVFSLIGVTIYLSRKVSNEDL